MVISEKFNIAGCIVLAIDLSQFGYGSLVSKEEIDKHLKIGDILHFEDKSYKIRGLEISRILMDLPKIFILKLDYK